MHYFVWVYCQKNDCLVHWGWNTECRVKHITGGMNKWILGEFKWLEMNCLSFHLWEQTEQISLSINQITCIWQSGPEYWNSCVLLMVSNVSLSRERRISAFVFCRMYLIMQEHWTILIVMLPDEHEVVSYYYCSCITGSSHLWGLLYYVTCEVSHVHAVPVWWCLH